jgi:peptidoglycan L-alanyl-D-glutamate endopeptidase CwlK
MNSLEDVQKMSAAVLNGLSNAAVRFAGQKLIEYAYKAGIEMKFTAGKRTFAEQDALYAQGRTKPGAIVTNAKAGSSIHNYDMALDFVLIVPGTKGVTWDLHTDYNNNRTSDWLEVVALAKLFGFEWGGDWTSFKDYPHIQMMFGMSLSDLKAGKKPSDAQIGAVIAKIQKWELEEKDVADNQLLVEKIEVQNDIIAAMEKRLAAVEKRLNISGTETYASQYTEAVEAAKANKTITTVADKSKIELNIIQMLYNSGVIPKIKK